MEGTRLENGSNIQPYVSEMSLTLSRIGLVLLGLMVIPNSPIGRYNLPLAVHRLPQPILPPPTPLYMQSMIL